MIEIVWWVEKEGILDIYLGVNEILRFCKCGDFVLIEYLEIDLGIFMSWLWEIFKDEEICVF